MGTFGNALTLLEQIGKSGEKLNIVIEGETGVGKEVALQHFIRNTNYPSKGMIALNVSAIQEALIESEIFGYEKGAFTGAYQTKKGLMERANGWMAFDEVTSMSLAFQAKLLRAIESKVFYRVGGTAEIKHDLCFISLTNESLSEAHKNGKFRDDLMYRLAGIVVKIPPLRERKEEIGDLFFQFSEMQTECKARTKLMSHDWPGNVRELKNVAARARLLATISHAKKISPSHIEFIDNGNAEMATERKTLENAISGNNFQLWAILQYLNVSRATFYRLLSLHHMREWFHQNAIASRNKVAI